MKKDWNLAPSLASNLLYV